MRRMMCLMLRLLRQFPLDFPSAKLMVDLIQDQQINPVKANN